jgi:BirA family biotin operon repressor/biotin-[acetyl-CoA-carboxylase] ligase
MGATPGTGFKTGGGVLTSMNDTQRAVLAAIEESPTPGPEIAEGLGVTRAAVWKAVEELREAGFVIDSSEDGYVLTEVPEYGAGAVEFRTERAFAVEHHESLRSTNARARDLARRGRFGREDTPGVVVLADEQTGGRGRLDREWTSPAGGVWMSVLMRPDLPPARAPLLTLAAAVATARAVDGVGTGSIRVDGSPDRYSPGTAEANSINSSVDPYTSTGTDGTETSVGLKWPNDVLAVDGTGRERKLAGILTEMEGETDAVSWVVVGIGLNANVDVAELPDGASSLRELRGDVDRGRLVGSLLTELDRLRSSPEKILSAWRDRSLTLGRQVRVETGEGAVVGEAVGVDPPGALLVDTGNETVRVHAGDCEHLRLKRPGRSRETT